VVAVPVESLPGRRAIDDRVKKKQRASIVWVDARSEPRGSAQSRITNRSLAISAVHHGRARASKEVATGSLDRPRVRERFGWRSSDATHFFFLRSGGR